MKLENRKIVVAKRLVIACAIPVLLYAFAAGPDPGKAGVPGESTCAECHGGAAGQGSVRITAAGANYTPGVKQRLSVRVEDPNQRRWGFQLTARLASSATTMAGSFAPTDGNTQVVCALSNLFPTACRAGLLEYIEQTEAGSRAGTTGGATFEFDWTPPATDLGDIVLYAAGNAANNDRANTGDRIYTTTLRLSPAVSKPKPSITQNGVVNGASFAPGIAPATWITLRGTNLAPGTRNLEYSGGMYPTQADTVSATVNGKPAFLYFLSSEQLNLVSPDDTSTGSVQVVVTRDGVASDPMSVNLAGYSPAFFLWPGNQAVATDPSFNFRARAGTFPGATTIPVKPGDVIILWGTGFGPTDPVVAAGRQVPSDRIYNVAKAVRVTIGGVEATFIGAALAPGFSSLYQIAVQVPTSVSDGDQPVIATIEGVSSPSTTILTIQR